MKKLLLPLLLTLPVAVFANAYLVNVTAASPYIYNYLDGYTSDGGVMPTTGFQTNATTYILSSADAVVGITLGSSQIGGTYLHIAIPNADAILYPNEHMIVTCSSGSAAYDTTYKGFKATVKFGDGSTQNYSCPSLAYNQGQIITFPESECSPVSVFATGTTTINLEPL